MSVKGKLLKKAATKIKKKIGSMNSTDNMSSKGPIDNAIKKVKKPSINDPLPKVYHTRKGESSFQYFQRTGKQPKHFSELPFIKETK
jgi:hypothetical protein